MSQETHAARWIGFASPCCAGAGARRREFEWPWQAHEAAGTARCGRRPSSGSSFLAHRSGRRARHPQVLRIARTGPGEKSGSTSTTAGSSARVPGLPEAAQGRGSTPLAYMRKYGASSSRTACADTRLAVSDEGPRGRPGRPVTRLMKQGGQDRRRDRRRVRRGFPRPRASSSSTRRRSRTGGGPSRRSPGYMRGQVHWSEPRPRDGEMVLLPTFRLPTLIHTRSGNAKWLQEITHTNPLWVHPDDAARSASERRSRSASRRASATSSSARG